MKGYIFLYLVIYSCLRKMENYGNYEFIILLILFYFMIIEDRMCPTDCSGAQEFY